MTREMTADRALSYNDATKMCKDLLKARLETSAANDDVNSAGKRTASR